MKITADLIEELIGFGIFHKMINNLDVYLVRNQLIDLLKVDEPSDRAFEATYPDYPVEILNKLINQSVKRGIIDDSLSEKDILDAKIMSLFMPRPSELYNKYENIRESIGVEAATTYYYNLSKLSNYIKTDRIARNKYWKCETESGELEITINLSKPEKDPKDIAKAGRVLNTNYPKCLLCAENVGYTGHINHPARSSHRVIPLKLNGEEWFYQYSPYVYYNEHAIIFKARHEPMRISRESFVRLTDFVEIMPHYFIGSNADLPIVGGSILSHDHFQGGNHRFPMVDAKVIKEYTNSDFKGVKISIVDWPMSVIRISGENKEDLVNMASFILDKWRAYSDKSVGILASSCVNGEDIPHNTITPIARKNDNGNFELDLVLRNNRCDEEHPDGIYHPHKHLHHIKKENIGLIEVMGLAILPPRIEKDLVKLSEVLQGVESLSFVESKMENHFPWFSSIKNSFNSTLTKDEADCVLQKAVASRFSEVLECAGVFKKTDQGFKAFDKFLKECSCY
ncbi:UDP-glucose--hexose-1-phosphate uridylyltransferase [Thiospirochaeta perfilievii]|uniref:Galactose-1-phosphate uridylyltransferase n=1 Tax=Thiospirochaeta perfilievii TaxID=252967 RepID=A0A5C1QDN8_9SPIO|nr:UDP-glucose--hexose-1-phosphate uridylyltransferase [Thiospirochaeta perfilievii]QEN05478.1 UDP-glucose--hexose-1-phosphate uridylyltransferase [Thiospirochaeta perfilievii]